MNVKNNASTINITFSKFTESLISNASSFPRARVVIILEIFWWSLDFAVGTRKRQVVFIVTPPSGNPTIMIEGLQVWLYK